MADTNIVWPQGEDLKLRYIYKEGADENSLVTIDLSTNYQVRMDLVVPTTKERIYTFNSADITDVDDVTAGAQPDTNKEATLSNGAGGTPNITIKVPRTLTLPGGAVYIKMTGAGAIKVYAFDVFLRNTSTNEQIKVDRGTITIEESYTLWL